MALWQYQSQLELPSQAREIKKGSNLFKQSYYGDTLKQVNNKYNSSAFEATEADDLLTILPSDAFSVHSEHLLAASALDFDVSTSVNG